MGKLDVTDRLEFLAKKFDVFESTLVGSDDEVTDNVFNEKKAMDLAVEGVDVKELSHNDSVIAILVTKLNKRGVPITNVSVSYDVFTAMVGADPTPNKICLQWMMNIFVRLVKDNHWGEAGRLYSEDLPQANEYLRLFEANKRKKKFRELAKYSLRGFKDITNINEYKSLSQLFDAVDPFIVRDPSGFESLMDKYMMTGQAKIPFKDRRYTVYVPLTTNASTIFDRFSSWCTARAGNSMFERYTNDLKPNGDKSNLYIVIDNGFFNGENEKMYQIHFESNQIMDRSNTQVKDFYQLVLSKSEGLTNYFGDELRAMAKDVKGGIDKNIYIDKLIDFGFTEALFDFFDGETQVISIDSSISSKKRIVRRLPDVSRFKNITHFVILDSCLSELHPSLGSLTTLKNLTVANNEIEVIPSEIGRLNKLMFLNLWNNPIKTIPDNIKYLDKSNGGNLIRLVVNKSIISEANYQKLKELLPNVIIQ